ncbi:MAG: hypothetical protein RJB10_1344, partial [Pseudomonadota bacterium]
MIFQTPSRPEALHKVGVRRKIVVLPFTPHSQTDLLSLPPFSTRFNTMT